MRHAKTYISLGIINMDRFMGVGLTAKNTTLMDIVKTPLTAFAMLDVNGIPDTEFGSMLYSRGKRAMAFDVTGYEYIPHLIQLAKDHPDIAIAQITNMHGWTYTPGKLGDMVKDDYILPIAEDFAGSSRKLIQIVGNPNQLMTTTEAAFDYVRGEVLYDIWEQLAKQHGTNFFCYDEKGVAGIRHANGEFRIASDDGGANNGHGRFEFRIYGAIPQETKQGIIYPVETLELHLEETLTGYGADDFEKQFMED
jgi:hypothetical protein